MAKDPAFLFYPNDWLGGTMGMTFEHKGAYMELLMMQFNRGHMTKDMIGQTIGQHWDNIQDKFTIDDNGCYYNERLEEEQLKRKRYTDSRKNNKSGKNQHSSSDKNQGHMTSHMEDENVNKDIIKKGVAFEFVDFWNSYDHKIGKHLTEKKWNLLNDDKKEAIMKVVLEYVKSTPDKHYRKHPLTWLHGKHWMDDITTVSNGIPDKPTPIWISKNTQNATLWMEACKKWRSLGWEYKQQPGATVKNMDKPNAMKEIILKVITKKDTDLFMSLEEMRKFPTFRCRQIVLEEKLVTIEYTPSKGFDEEGFKILVKDKFKVLMNAHYVEIVERKKEKRII